MKEIVIKGYFTIKTDDPKINERLNQNLQPLTHLRLGITYRPDIEIVELSTQKEDIS